MLASVDYAHQRHGQAVQKYAACYDWFEAHGLPAQQALCLGGLGDVLLATGRLVDAKERYQQALALAAPQGAAGLPVVMLVAAKAGDVCMATKDYREAEGYLDIASQIAGTLLSLELKCDLMEKIGLARSASHDVGGAVKIWRQAIEICRQGDYFVRWRSILANMAAFYGRCGLGHERREVQLEHDAIDRICKERYL